MAKLSMLEKSQGQALIFLHGMGLNAETWRYQLNAFAPHYKTIALDLPGYGKSEALNDVSFTNYARALHTFVQEHNLLKPILVGHSFGAMIAQEYLALYPNELSAVVFYGTSPTFGKPEGKWQQAFIKAHLGPLEEGKSMLELADILIKRMSAPQEKPSAETQDALELARSAIATASADVFKSSVHCLTSFDQRENLAKINIPSLVIVGEEDKNAPAVMMQSMADAIQNAQFTCLAKLGHLAHLENPPLFNAALRSFLESLEHS